MSRTIKFRAFCKKHGCWEFYTLGDLVCGSTCLTNGEGGEFKNWCEWTGLLDKNGKEIYEGDILERGEPTKVRKVVEWLHRTNQSIGWNIGEKKKMQWTVVGNIYETPELIPV